MSATSSAVPGADFSSSPTTGPVGHPGQPAATAPTIVLSHPTPQKAFRTPASLSLYHEPAPYPIDSNPTPFHNLTNSTASSQLPLSAASQARVKASRKRNTDSSIGAGSAPKRTRRTATSGAITAAPCGVGPPEVLQPTLPPSVLETPTSAPPAHSNTAKVAGHNTNATDVWYFMRGLDIADEPIIRPTDEPQLFKKPKTKFIGCKLCMYVSTFMFGCILNFMTLENGKFGIMATE